MKEFSRVYLVGSGPSDASLLTLRAKELIESADVIIYDALVDSSIHRMFPTKAKLYNVGKRAGAHAMRQEEINALIVSVALSQGGKIVRLKGGDPFVFGRGGEEMQALRNSGISYEIVPGVTAGIAAPAYWGVPVTHRGLSRSVTLVAAFTKDGGLPNLDWQAYAHLDGTLVFYMSMRVVPQIAEALMRAGKGGDVQAAIISEGTRPTQCLVKQELKTFAVGREDYEIYSPGIFVVGEVLEFADQYQWYQKPTLTGKKVLVTRSEGQTSELTALLEREGAEVRVLPTFQIQQELHPTFELNRYKDVFSVLALTSPNAVHSFMNCLATQGLDARALSIFKTIAVVGPATAKALASYGVRPDITAQVHTAEGLSKEIALLKPQRVLLPTSNLGGAILLDALQSQGIEVDCVCVYRNEPIDYKTEDLEQVLESVDWLTFCSSSAANNFYSLLKSHGLESRVESKIGAIGPSTAATLTSLGWSVTAEPSKPDMEEFVAAIVSASISM